MKMPRELMIAAGIALASGSAAAGPQIYAVNVVADTPDGSDTLVTFDADNPSEFTTVGSLGVPEYSFGGLDFDESGNLWAYATLFQPTGGAGSGLYQIDPASGQATAVGSSDQTLQDLAYNPTNGTMYGINTRQASESTLFEVDTTTGTVSELGVLSGLPQQRFLNGLAIDGNGDLIVHDVINDQFFKGSGTGDDFSVLYDLPQDTNFGQGMTVDWSRDGLGYHGAVGFGPAPNFFSQINTFETDGSAYTLGDNFGRPDMDGVPPVQPGDVAIMPVPSPGAAAPLLLASALAGGRRRRGRWSGRIG